MQYFISWYVCFLRIEYAAALETNSLNLLGDADNFGDFCAFCKFVIKFPIFPWFFGLKKTFLFSRFPKRHNGFCPKTKRIQPKKVCVGCAVGRKKKKSHRSWWLCNGRANVRMRAICVSNKIWNASTRRRLWPKSLQKWNANEPWSHF